MTFSSTSLDSLLGQMDVVSIPLETDFRGIRHREVALLSGPNGPGEWAAFTEYDDERQPGGYQLQSNKPSVPKCHPQ